MFSLLITFSNISDLSLSRPSTLFSTVIVLGSKIWFMMSWKKRLKALQIPYYYLFIYLLGGGAKWSSLNFLCRHFGFFHFLFLIGVLWSCPFIGISTRLVMFSQLVLPARFSTFLCSEFYHLGCWSSRNLYLYSALVLRKNEEVQHSNFPIISTASHSCLVSIQGNLIHLCLSGRFLQKKLSGQKFSGKILTGSCLIAGGLKSPITITPCLFERAPF